MTPKPKAGSLNEPATVAGQRVLSYVQRVEKLLEERKAIGADIRDIFMEAKGNGYDVKTLRKLVQIRAMDAAERDEANALLDTYASAIGMEVGTFAREPDEDDLIERASKIIREVDLCATHLVAVDGTPPKIEAIKRLIGCSTGKAHKLRAMVIDRLAGFSSSNADSMKTGNENPPEGESCGPDATPAEDSGHAPEPATTPDRSAFPNHPQPDSHSTGEAREPIEESCGGVESRHAAHQNGDAEALPPLSAASSRPGKTQSPSSVRQAQGIYPTALAAGVAPGPQEPDDFPIPKGFDKRRVRA